ncbi:Protein SRSX-28, partial [Aphelenchoides avenae]
YLVALSSIFDTMHLAAHVTMSFTVFTGINVIPLSQCFYLQAAPIAGLVGGQIVVLLIAVDRLLSLVFPIWHRSLNKSSYLTMQLLTCVFASGSYLYMGYLNQMKAPDEYVFCIILEGVHGHLVDVFSSCAVLANAAIVAIYAVVLVLVRKRGADAVNRQIMRSLTWIIAVVSGGWFVTVTCVTVLNYFLELSPTQTPASFAYLGIFVNIGCASNFFILYKC